MIKIKLRLHTTPVVYGHFTCVFVFIPPPCASRIHQPAGFADSPWASQPLAVSPRWATPAETLFLLVLPKSRGRCSLAGVGPGGRVCPGCWVGAPARPPGHASVQSRSSGSHVHGHRSRLLHVVGCGCII